MTYQYLVANAPSSAPAAEAILSLRIPAQRVSKPTCACDWEARRTRDTYPYNFRLPLRMLHNVECPPASLANYTVLGLELSSCEMRIYVVKCHMNRTWDDLRYRQCSTWTMVRVKECCVHHSTQTFCKLAHVLICFLSSSQILCIPRTVAAEFRLARSRPP